MAERQDTTADSGSKSDPGSIKRSIDLEGEDKDESIEFSFAHFEHHWRLCLINFERQRLKHAGIYCGHKELLCGLDVDLFAEDMQSMILQETIESVTSSLHKTHYKIKHDSNCQEV